RLDSHVGVGADEIGRLRTRRTLDLAGNDELLGVEIRELRVFDHQLIAATEIDDDVVVGLVRGVLYGLKRREIEVANVDAVAGLQVRDGVDASAVADEEGIIVRAADHHVLAGTAQQQVSATAAEKMILAILSDQRIVAASAEQVIIAFAAENQIIAAPAESEVFSTARRNRVVAAKSEEDFALVGSIEGVVAARSELESRFDRHVTAPALIDGRIASVASFVDKHVTRW